MKARGETPMVEKWVDKEVKEKKMVGGDVKAAAVIERTVKMGL